MKQELKPQAYSSIYWLIEDGKIDPEQLFVFFELYWPTFIKKDGYVFLKEQFSEEEYENSKDNPEFWINFLTVDDYFIDAENSAELSKNFSKTLVEIWKAKLEKDFPSIEFTVEYLEDEEAGDYGLTFYQTKHLS